MSEIMKKSWLFLGTLLLAGTLFIRGVDAYITNQATTATVPAGNALYVPVENVDGVAHEVGDVVVWNDGTNDGVEITTTTTANNGLVAGVIALRDIAAGPGVFGLVQVAGYHSGVTISVANSAGDSLVTSTTAEGAGVYTIAQATGTAANQAVIDGVFATAFAASTSSTTVAAIIRAL